MTTRSRVGLATSADVSDSYNDAPALLAALAARGVAAEQARWDDPAVDWAGYDLVVIRSTWDYIERRKEFVAWADAVPRLLNPADIVRWNTDKAYLADLASAGVPVVPSVYLLPGDPVELPATGDYVVKPAVGAGAKYTARYNGAEAGVAQTHVDRLHRSRRTAIVQPYLAEVDVRGETALLFLGGEYSHSIRKEPMLVPGTGDPGGAHRPQTIASRIPHPAEIAVARRALQATPGGPDRLLYARVDLLPGPAGSPLLLELELTEPSLFLDRSSGAAERFAAAIELAADRAAAAMTS